MSLFSLGNCDSSVENLPNILSFNHPLTSLSLRARARER